MTEPKEPDTKLQNACQPDPKETLDWGNSQGIAPPSETARPLMERDSYVGGRGTVRDSTAEDETSAAAAKPASMEFANEFHRKAPTQKNWPK